MLATFLLFHALSVWGICVEETTGESHLEVLHLNFRIRQIRLGIVKRRGQVKSASKVAGLFAGFPTSPLW
jgi:hypothetical protein